MTTDLFIRTRDHVKRGEASRMYAAIADGRLVSLRRGWHLSQTTIAGLSPEGRELLAARAAFGASSGEGFVFSHRTAAAIHGIPLLRQRDDPPRPRHGARATSSAIDSRCHAPPDPASR